MGWDSSLDIAKPLVCPKCGKEPKYSVFEHKYKGIRFHQFYCCVEVGAGRRWTKQSAVERWNTMALEYAISHQKED